MHTYVALLFAERSHTFLRSRNQCDRESRPPSVSPTGFGRGIPIQVFLNPLSSPATFQSTDSNRLRFQRLTTMERGLPPAAPMRSRGRWGALWTRQGVGRAETFCRYENCQPGTFGRGLSRTNASTVGSATSKVNVQTSLHPPHL